MAKVEPMAFTGRIGNTIHYKMGNGYYVRSLPRKFKQTKATKLRAGQFGLASKIGSAIRSQLIPVIPDPSDRKMRGRLVAVIFQWLNAARGKGADADNPRHIDLFQFEEKQHSLHNRWKVAFQVKNPSPGLVEIKIPEFVPVDSIEAPTGTTSVVCKIAAGVCDAADGVSLGGFTTELVYAFDSKPVAAQTLSLKLPTPKGCLIVTGMALEYRHDKTNMCIPTQIRRLYRQGSCTSSVLN